MKATTDLCVVKKCKQISVGPTKSLQWRCFTSIALLLSLFIAAQNAAAGSFTWIGFVSGDWNNRNNWMPPGVPGLTDFVHFGRAFRTRVFTSANTGVSSIDFATNASQYSITIPTSLTFTFSGAGITNSSGKLQGFVAEGGTAPGKIVFTNSATAGIMTLITGSGSSFEGGIGGVIEFSGTSTGGSATLQATDGSSNDGGGKILFLGNSTGGTSSVGVFGNGVLDISGHNAPGVIIGSLAATGEVSLGGKNLFIGANNKNESFSGEISGAGGSITKVGTGRLNLLLPSSSNGNSYTGGTFVEQGTLGVQNFTTGSATGSGPVQVFSGALGGTGKILGRVNIGSPTTTDAILQTSSGTTGGTLTINSTVTFHPKSEFKVYLDRFPAPFAGKLSAMGITIDTNVNFTLIETRTATITPGKVFTVIENTSANPIFGRFHDVPEGKTITGSLGDHFKVSYTGGNGNDMTLTKE